MNIQEQSGNAPQNAMNVNCSCYGSNILIRFDTMDILRMQFQKFEKRFRNNEHTYYDLKLPFFIIESFSKLWKLWKEIPEFHELVEVKMFQDIFTDMLSTFQTDKMSGANITESNCQQAACLNVVCNVCDEPIPIFNDDIHLSYDLHAQSVKHNKITEKPTNENAYLNNEVKSEVVKARKVSSDETRRSRSPPWLKKKAIKIENGLPSTASSSKCAADFSQSSGLRPKNNFYRTKPKLPTYEDPYCSICCRDILGSKEIVAEHANGKSHARNLELLAKCENLLNVNKSYIEFSDRSKFEFICKLCEKKQTGTNCFLQHFKSKEHETNLRKMKDINLTKRISQTPSTSALAHNHNVLQFL